ncbi:Leucine-rich receptor-like protein kinase family protein [Quillaja saponaria]|uniref:Leucine-rich receptor-like protein kinase family protein n=1 Tax=Quillaja saponaria TaxID=32244 RepID=A0AAD7M2L0_QUISA|nr:Leucine-rich receptor-like protein kinase family protein [Quillaja saponaria]
MINMQQNNLSGQLPKNIFNHLPELQELYLSHNQFYGEIPPSLFNCKQLQNLSMSYNNFTGTIPVEIGNSTLLLEIFFSFNKLQGTIPDEIGKLSNLENLGLQFNNLTGNIPSAVFNISTLVEISLTSNQLTGSVPPNIGLTLPNLERLHLFNNSLTGPILSSISNSTKLAELDLAYNSFSAYIPSTLGDLRNLQWLNLAYNNLTFESSSHAMRTFLSLGNCKYLQRIELSENPLNFVLPTSIGNFSSFLDHFGLENCNIKGGIPDDIGNMLNFLNLASNQITGTIPAIIGNLRGLQTLYLYHNQLQGYIPQEICQLERIWSFFLSDNKFSGQLPTCFGNLKSLRELSLSSNRLNSTLPSTLWGLEDILYLDLSSNNLTGSLPLSIGNLKVVTELYLSDNQLSENNLSGVIPKSLEALVYLKRFNVSFNKLQGEIPDGGPFKNFIGDSFMKNKALCGASHFQVLPCRTEAFGEGDTKTNTMTMATIGYMAPEYEYGLEGTVSRRGDVYSYGILLLETFTRHKHTELFLGELSLKQWVQSSFPHAILQIVDRNLLMEEEEHFDIKKDCLSSIIGLALDCSEDAPDERTNMKTVLAALNKMKRNF